MNKYIENIIYVGQLVVLGTSILSAWVGYTNLAVAGIAIYLLSLHGIKGGN